MYTFTLVFIHLSLSLSSYPIIFLCSAQFSSTFVSSMILFLLYSVGYIHGKKHFFSESALIHLI